MMTIVITGTSKGLGKALFDILVEKKVNIICISRKFLEYQKLLSERESIRLLETDLSKIDSFILDELIQILENEYSSEEIFFINNAGIVDPIGEIGFLDEKNIEEAVNVNYLSPMLIINKLVYFAKNQNKRMKIINITSGAANIGIVGWGLYCSSKAALKMFLNVLEKQIAESNIEVCNIDPGVMDTEMQETIRGQNIIGFPEQEYFKKLKTEGLLKTPSYVAKKILKEEIMP